MRALPLFLLLSASPALADVVADTADTTEEDDTDKDGGCASAPMSSEALGSVALGALLLVGLRRGK